ncbi:PE-PPE domain-containing protein [Nocardia grenadensis]|uniref:PE-PPE domain-containing protein n=1 Tax=Nocardia grenadensis TaxID=931537 RepID=UPI003D758E84
MDPVINVLCVGGTGESYPGDTRTEVTGGMLGYVTRNLGPGFRPRWVGYPAQYGPVSGLGGLSFRQSVKAGADNLLRVLEDTPGRIVLLGYSQGCTVVRQLLHDAPPAVRRVEVVGLVADPEAPPNGDANYGVLGTDPVIPYWVTPMWVTNPKDPICNAAPDSLLRDFADLTEYFGFSDAGRWMLDVLEGLKRRSPLNRWGADSWSLASILAARDRVNRSIAEAWAYLPRIESVGGLVINPSGGQHTTAYLRMPELTGLADRIRSRMIV